jgi:signal transduction histidine kinase
MVRSWLQDLTTESTIADLPSHEAMLSLEAPGDGVLAEFERRPDLPGVTVHGADGQLVAMISRGLFFQRLSRPYSRDVYLNRPLRVFLDWTLPEPLIVAPTCRIASAAALALDRPMEHAYEPLVVRGAAGDVRVIDVYVLLRAQSHLLALAQAAMLQSEKLASIGQLAAGVAHEVNNPLAFVSNNVAVIQRDAAALAEALALYRRAEGAIAQLEPELHAQLRRLDERLDLIYTASNLPELAARSREGLRRIQGIVRDLREFARADIGDETDIDLNDAITSTANIIAGRAKAGDIAIDLQLLKVPMVPGNPSRINQVIMNLLANAVDACHPHGHVTVRSRAEAEAVALEVEDTGDGIDPSIANRIYDPFFTTKPPGKGTGLGLTISYGVVRDHSGLIDFVTERGKGTTFRVLLPRRRGMSVSADVHGE